MNTRRRFFNQDKKALGHDIVATPQKTEARKKNPFSFLSFPFTLLLKIARKLFSFRLGTIGKAGKQVLSFLLKNVSFMLLLLLYFAYQVILHPKAYVVITKVFGTNGQKRLFNGIFACINKLDPNKKGTIRKIDLIRLSIRNMKAKKTRTIITIGGMTIGIATIVFFVSIGYGLQQLVLSRVVRLDQLRQADVSSQVGSKVKVDDKSLSEFKQIPNVTEVLPLLSVVGQVNYQGSISDMAVYGVTTEYLKQSDVKPISGMLFDSNQIARVLPSLSPSDQAVAGAETQVISQNKGDTIEQVSFSIIPGEWIRVRSGPALDAPILGYTKRAEGQQTGQEVWGDDYASTASASANSVQSIGGKTLGRWISAPVFLWEKKTCDVTQGDCENGQYVVMRDSSNSQVQKRGYFAELNISLTGTDVSNKEVLGVQTSAADTTGTQGTDLPFVNIASLSAKPKTAPTKTVTLSGSAVKQAVVNQSMLKVLGINENQAVGKTFTVSFVVTGDLLSDPNQKVQSEPAQYRIVGIVQGTQTPLFYVPFIDLRALGVTSYSQAKVVVNDNNALDKVRREIEAKGYTTSSVVDTVAQINSVFNTARTLLALVGFVALAVASLGMLNTLTVSLLERTREVGLMKTMGMKSEEVKELFLTESMIMAFFGGIFGLIVGFIVGKLLGLVLSIFTVLRGAGMVDVSSIPLSFVIVIIFLSLVVGLVTGIYPANRATKISALDALRYE